MRDRAVAQPSSHSAPAQLVDRAAPLRPPRIVVAGRHGRARRATVAIGRSAAQDAPRVAPRDQQRVEHVAVAARVVGHDAVGDRERCSNGTQPSTASPSASAQPLDPARPPVSGLRGVGEAALVVEPARHVAATAGRSTPPRRPTAAQPVPRSSVGLERRRRRTRRRAAASRAHDSVDPRRGRAPEPVTGLDVVEQRVAGASRRRAPMSRPPGELRVGQAERRASPQLAGVVERRSTRDAAQLDHVDRRRGSRAARPRRAGWR